MSTDKNTEMLNVVDTIFSFVFNLLGQYLIENRVLVEVNFTEIYPKGKLNVEFSIKPCQGFL